MALSLLETIELNTKTEMNTEGIDAERKESLQKTLWHIREIKEMYSNRVDEIIASGKVVVYGNGDIRFVWSGKDNRIEEGGIETEFSHKDMIIALGGNVAEVANLVIRKYKNLIARQEGRKEETLKEMGLAEAA